MSDIQGIVINLIGLIIQILIFVYGLINALKGMLSPKRMGVVISAFFASLCLADSNRIFGNAAWQLVYVAVMLMIPSIIGATAAYLYFIRARVEKIVPVFICVASVWGILRIFINNYELIRYAGQYVSMNTALSMLLKTCIYILIMYQTYILVQKRKRAVEADEQDGA